MHKLGKSVQMRQIFESLNHAKNEEQKTTIMTNLYRLMASQVYAQVSLAHRKNEYLFESNIHCSLSVKLI